MMRPAPSPTDAVPPTPEPASAPQNAVLGTNGSPDLSGPSSLPADIAGSRLGFGDGLGWTTVRSAWLKSLVGAAGVVLIGLLLIGLLPGLALSDLWPFGGDTSSIGSETVAGPAVDETSTTSATDVSRGAPGDSSFDLLDPVSTVSTSAPTVPSTAPTTTFSTLPSTTRTTATTSATTSASTSTSSSTTATTATTGTTETSGTSSTDQDTTSSSTTETTARTETTEPPPRPRIVRFTTRASDPTLGCNRRNEATYEAIWATENTESVELFLPNGATVAGKPNGVHPFCGQPGDSISLIAFGPGGDDKASTTLG